MRDFRLCLPHTPMQIGAALRSGSPCYVKSLISSSETAEGVSTPRSVKSIVMYDGGV